MTLVRKCFVLAVAMLGFAAAGQAQFAVYAGVTGERITGIACTDPLHQCASNDGVSRPYGVSFGTYYDFRDYRSVRIGADLHGAVLNTNKSAYSYQGGTDINREYSFLGGVRGTFKTRYTFVRPYVEAAFGYARSNAISLGYQNYTQVQGIAGVDIPLGGAIDFRAIEFSAGGLFGSGTHGTQSIGAGIVFHTRRQ